MAQELKKNNHQSSPVSALPGRVWTPYELNQLRQAGRAGLTRPASDTTPVEYITGQVEFRGQVYRLTPQVLIPRVETEELVDLAIRAARQTAAHIQPIRLADVGTGAGVIGLSLARELTAAGVEVEAWLSDISAEALGLARLNARSQHLVTGLHFLESDVMADFPENLSFDLITANLPYIPSSRIATLDPSVKEHEPHLALDGGPEGLTLINTLLAQAETRLKPGGQLILEIDYTHTPRDFAFDRYKLSLKIKIDSFKRSRFAVFTLAEKKV